MNTKDGTMPTPTAPVRKDPDQWVTKDQPMTAAQLSFLKILCEQAGEPCDEKLTKAQGAKKIDELQKKRAEAKK